MYCRFCGKKGNENAIACTGCGVAPLNGNAFCNNCGESTYAEAIMCVNCGASLSNKKIRVGQLNDNPLSQGMAILWALICWPIGYMQWGQAAKGWTMVGISTIISLATFGYGGSLCYIVVIVDYIMSYQAQTVRKLEPWEFFPSKQKK